MTEIRAWAERVLFSTSLADKLDPGGALSDVAPGPALGVPGEPGRPAELRMRRGAGQGIFPSGSRLMDEEKRGLLLHVLANHELLATELMALVLLKFPDAPAEFRRGIVRTLREEQEHTGWYVGRMAECGVRFGDFPVNRFFWDAIAPMETPMDYVTRLSLTFEQANLDFARHYAAIMREAGDERTAATLSRIYHDEIAHVGYGLKWFRRWKDAGHSDWDAYRRRLPFPLSPARGRGNAPFNAEGRRRAGLDPTFICEMEVFRQSRGRTPDVFWFTADAEAAMAAGDDGRSFTPRRDVRELSAALEILPAFLGGCDDVVLMERPPSLAHRLKLHRLGLEIPECVATREAHAALGGRRLGRLRPWAWCPRSAALLRPFDPGTVAARWNPSVRRLFGKDWQAGHFGLDSTVCRSRAEIGSAIDHFADAGHAECLAKAPYGAAGQRNRPLTRAHLDAPWLRRVLAEQGAVVVEPRLERVFDFSAQYERTDAGVRLLGFVRLENDRRGQFRASVAAAKFLRGAPPEAARLLAGGALAVYENSVRAAIEAALAPAGYQGPVGIDAFVFRSPDGAVRLRPVVEMNPRYTMGRLTWELMRRVAPGRTVRLELLRAQDPEGEAARREAEAPAMCNRDGKLLSGCVALNEPAAVLAVVTVDPDGRRANH